MRLPDSFVAVIVVFCCYSEHESYLRNEEEKTIARKGSEKLFLGTEPFCGIAKTMVKSCIVSWMLGITQD